MSTITASKRSSSTVITDDGPELYYKDWGEGPPVIFSHGWPLNSDMWYGQMLFLVQNGFRAIAHDRRGHGRSSQTSSGNDMNGFADDLAAVIEALDLNDVTVVGHSTGGGEVTRYIGRHGTSRVAKAVLISAVPPGLMQSDANPEGLPIEAFNGLLAGLMEIDPSSTRTWRFSSTAPTGPAPRSRRASSTSSGAEHAVWPEELLRER